MLIFSEEECFSLAKGCLSLFWLTMLHTESQFLILIMMVTVTNFDTTVDYANTIDILYMFWLPCYHIAMFMTIFDIDRCSVSGNICLNCEPIKGPLETTRIIFSIKMLDVKWNAWASRAAFYVCTLYWSPVFSLMIFNNTLIMMINGTNN